MGQVHIGRTKFVIKDRKFRNGKAVAVIRLINIFVTFFLREYHFSVFYCRFSVKTQSNRRILLLVRTTIYILLISLSSIRTETHGHKKESQTISGMSIISAILNFWSRLLQLLKLWIIESARSSEQIADALPRLLKNGCWTVIYWIEHRLVWGLYSITSPWLFS